MTDLRRPQITIEETGEQVAKTAPDQIAVIGTLTSGATAAVHIREAVAGGTGFLWEINGTHGTLRITADAAYPEIFPLTLWAARGGNEPAELAAPAALTQKWPALASLEGAPAYNVGRAYAAFAADIDNGTHTVPDFADAVERHEVIAAIERSAASWDRVKASPLHRMSTCPKGNAHRDRTRRELPAAADIFTAVAGHASVGRARSRKSTIPTGTDCAEVVDPHLLLPITMTTTTASTNTRARPRRPAFAPSDFSGD